MDQFGSNLIELDQNDLYNRIYLTVWYETSSTEDEKKIENLYAEDDSGLGQKNVDFHQRLS